MEKRKKAGRVTSVRLFADEEERLEMLWRRVQQRIPIMDKTWMIRELLGLETEVQLLTDEERTFFRTGARLEPPHSETIRKRA